jgi:hypothetical protein
MSSATSTVMLRPMGLLEIVDQTFRLYRRHFGVFFGIAAVVYVPWGVLQSIPVVNVLSGLLLTPFALVAGAALTKAVSDRYLGEQLSIGEAYRYIGRRFWPLVFTMILAYLMVLGGFILLIIPGIIFTFWVMLTAQVFVIEDKRYSQAIWRSKFLIGQGTWARLFVVGLSVGALTLIIQFVLMAVVGFSMFAGTSETGVMPIHVAILSGLIQALVLPLGQIATVLLYYDSRIRKEGFDLQMLAREMGVALPGPSGEPGEPTTTAGPTTQTPAAAPPPPAEPTSPPSTGTDQEGA